MKYEIAKRLKEAAPGYLSGGELGRLFKVSRTAVWKYIEELRREGYSIEAVPRLGYRLVSAEDRLNAYEISTGLETKIVGHEVCYFDSLDSTNNYARRIASEGCSDGTVVAAAQQTSGRGRLGRNWDSPPDRGIYISVVLKPPLTPMETPILTLAAAVAAVDAINEASGLKAGIKWPNDLVIEGKKVCGILVEMSSEADRVNYIVIGIGINYSQNKEDFPEALRDRAISLKMAAEKFRTATDKNGGAVDIFRNGVENSGPTSGNSGPARENSGTPIEETEGGTEKSGESYLTIAADSVKNYNRLSIVRTLLCKLDDVLQFVLEDKNTKIIEMWRDRSITLGREVSFSLKSTHYTGTAVDITEDGRLLVDCTDGARRELLSGEVSIRGIYGA